MSDDEFQSDLAVSVGAEYARRLDNGRLIGLTMTLTGWKLWLGDETGIERAFEYPPMPDAQPLLAYRDWSGEGDAPDGWVRAYPPMYRRRLGGDPATEEIRP